MSDDVARFLLKVRFPESDVVRMNELADKARCGALTNDEDGELKDFIHVGHLLERLKSEARQLLPPSNA